MNAFAKKQEVQKLDSKISRLASKLEDYGAKKYEVQNLEVDIVIPNSEFEIGDRFGIGAKAGQNNATEFHTINALQSYWVITDASKNVDLWNQEINA